MFFPYSGRRLLSQCIRCKEQGLNGLLNRNFSNATAHFQISQKWVKRMSERKDKQASEGSITHNAENPISIPTPKAGTPGLPPSFPIDEALPPTTFLSAAYKSGALDITPSAANQVLRRYFQLGTEKVGRWEERLCKEENVSPHTLHLLGLILNRGSKTPTRMLAKLLMLSSSALGHTPATLELLRAALRRGDLSREEYIPALKSLEILAGDGNVDAMTLLGKIYEKLGNDGAAMSMYEAVTRWQSETGSKEESGKETKYPAVEAKSGYAVAEALTALGHLLLKKGDRAGAYKAFQRAALEEDYAPGYYQLALLTESGDGRDIYLLKAAQSGVIDACHELASSLISKSKEPSEENGKNKNLEMAKEWLYLAADAGIGKSALALASLFKKEGDEAKAMEWLQSASKIPNVEKEAKVLIKEWS